MVLTQKGPRDEIEAVQKGPENIHNDDEDDDNQDDAMSLDNDIEHDDDKQKMEIDNSSVVERSMQISFYFIVFHWYQN